MNSEHAPFGFAGRDGVDANVAIKQLYLNIEFFKELVERS
jgi:hypothetical protein